MSGPRARGLLNLTLLIAAGSLISFIWLGAGPNSGPEAERLSTLVPGTITRMRIERRGRPALAFERDGSRWRMVTPVERPANPDKVTALLGLASARVHEAFRAIGNDLAVYGLEPPAARVWLGDEAFAFGDTDPLNGWRYILHGPDVHLITDAYFHHVLATPAAFLHPAPLAGVPRPTGISVTAAVRRAGGQNAGTMPPSEMVAGDTGRKLIDAWVAARAASVRALDPRLQWTDGVRVSLQGGAPDIRFQAAWLEHELALGRRDWEVQYHFPRAAARTLLAAD